MIVSSNRIRIAAVYCLQKLWSTAAAVLQTLCFCEHYVVVKPGWSCCLSNLPAKTAAATGNFSSSNSNTSRQRQSPVASAAAQALSQLQSAQQAQRGGDYAAALTAYSAVVAQHPDLALAEYARLGRALMLYEVGTAAPGRLDSKRQMVMPCDAIVHTDVVVLWELTCRVVQQCYRSSNASWSMQPGCLSPQLPICRVFLQLLSALQCTRRRETQAMR
jgi:hypothetical protein